MIVGTLEIRLYIRESRSLKEKRRVVKSLRDQIRNKFNVSIAEVDMLDSHQHAILGIAAVGNEQQFVNSVLTQIVNFFSMNTKAQMVDTRMEFFPV